jgi:hypothetical protein
MEMESRASTAITTTIVQAANVFADMAGLGFVLIGRVGVEGPSKESACDDSMPDKGPEF